MSAALQELQACDACGKYVRDWKHVALDVDGFHELTCRLCRACESAVRDAVRDVLRERRPK